MLCGVSRLVKEKRKRLRCEEKQVAGCLLQVIGFWLLDTFIKKMKRGIQEYEFTFNIWVWK